MVDGIHLRSEVTWDKPVPLDFGTEVRKTFTLLESIAISARSLRWRCWFSVCSSAMDGRWCA